MRALVASVALCLLVIAGCGDDQGTAMPALDPADLTVDHPCGHGFQVGSPDQQTALVFRPSGDESPAAGRHDLSDGRWNGTVRLGEDLFGNWCDDVLEAGEPTPEVREEWPIVAGTVDVELPSDGQWGPATLTAVGLVAERPDGSQVPIGDITVENARHGLVPG